MAPALLGPGSCSRARVESLNEMNEGVVLAAQGNHIGALERLESAAGKDPTNDQVYWNLAIVQMHLQKYEAAKDALQRAISANPQAGGYQEKLGTILIQLKDYEGAKTAFEKAIQTEPHLFKAHFKLGQIHELLDDPQQALTQYTEAVRKGPRFIEGYINLGGLYANVGLLKEAEQVLQSGLQVTVPGTEEEAELHNILGTVYSQQHEASPSDASLLGKAADAYRAALKIKPGMLTALFSLGWTYYKQDNREEARRYMHKFLDASGGKGAAHYIKAAQDVLAKLGSA